MPTAGSILTSMAEIANELTVIAVAWHGVVAAVLTARLAGWHPSYRLLARLQVLTMTSVSVSAWIVGNPFNGMTFAVLALLLVTVTRRLPGDRVQLAPWSSAAAGTALVGLGLVYPHFLRADSWIAYLYASPFALIPCPTLMVAIGTTFLFRTVGSMWWRTVLAIAGVFYGAVGVFTLHVWIDWPLLASALVLGAHVVRHARPAEPGLQRTCLRNREVHP